MSKTVSFKNNDRFIQIGIAIVPSASCVECRRKSWPRKQASAVHF